MRLLLPLVWVAACDPSKGTGLGGGGTPGDETGPGNTTENDTGDSGDTSAPEVDTASLEGTGYQAGDVAYDLTVESDRGEDWSLYSVAGDPVVLVVGHLDSSAMTLTLGELPQVDEAFPQAWLVAMVGRDEYSTTADADDAARWREDYGLEVVLLDSDLLNMPLWSDNNPPKTYVIGPDMTILWVGYGIVSAEEISAALQGSASSG